MSNRTYQSSNLLLNKETKTITKGRILVVEDESIVALDIKNSLESWGYNVIGIAQTGEEAIQKSLRIRPDLVLMDIRLQGDMDGIEAVRQIRTHVDIPFIYLTSYADSNLLMRAKLTAPFGYILKPFGDRELHIAIELSLYKHSRDKGLNSTGREQAQRETLLCLVVNQMHQTLDYKAVLQTAVREVRQLLHTSRVVVYQFVADLQGKVVVEDVDSCWSSILGDTSQDKCFSSKYVRLYQEGRVRAIDNIWQAGLDPCHVNLLHRLQVQANLTVPIVIGSSLWGLLIAHECQSPRVWHSWEIQFLQQLGLLMAIAIQQSELHRQLQTAKAQYQAQAEQLQATREDLQTTRSQLIQSDKLSSLGQMVAEVTHDINNALTSIHSNLPCVQSYAKLLEQAISSYETAYPQPAVALAECNSDLNLDYVRSDFPQMLHSMQEGAGRIRELILRLQNFSRLDAAQPQPVDLPTGIESTLALLQHRLKNGIKIIKQYSALPLVTCHAGQINQVFLNLLTNALDAVGEPAKLTICAWQSAPDWVAVSIHDNGPGIPPEIQLRIFEPFFTTKEVGKGTGLGLSICHQIIQAHGGRIHCISSPGRGTEFRVELPVSGLA